MSPNSIVYIVSSLGKSGPTKQLFNLVSNLDRNHFLPSIITLSPEPNSSMWDSFSQLDICLEPMNLTHRVGLYFARKKLKYFFRSHQSTIVHSQGIRSDYINSTLTHLTHRIASQRNDPYHDYPMQYGAILGSIMARSHISFLNKIPHVVACSESLRVSNLSHGLTTRCIRNGIALNDGQGIPSKIEKRAMRVKLGIDIEAKVFVWCGPFISRKSPDFLVNVFNKLSSRFNFVLCMIGAGPLLSKCKKIAYDNSSIVFPGFIDNVDDYLVAGDLFISSSSAEGLPNAVLEALARGLPPILSDITPHREILELSKYAGTLYASGDERSLTQALVYFNPTKEQSTCARNIVLGELNASRMSSEYQALYREISNHPITKDYN